ncbi:hypothetical protein ACE1ET_20480 [Saccharicrinis sp. FJH62]|uniref:hypothetical protein n=1 Tax=Saccharicrinis sp. FJH62 TaxID=3344657 RepID=UPI0035D4675B
MLEKLRHKILNPNNNILVISTLISIPILTFILWRFSFSWWTPFIQYAVGLIVLLIIIAIIFKSIDKKIKTRIFPYSTIWISTTIILTGLSYPTRDYLIVQSENRGKLIIEKIEEYKEKNGMYPENIKSEFFKNTPKWTCIGTQYLYEKYDDQSNFILRYDSFYGCYAVYDKINNDWKYKD